MSEELRDKFKGHVDRSAAFIARDLVNLLERAHSLGVAICPDVDEREGISYSLEWVFGNDHEHIDVTWNPHSSEWIWE